MKYKFIFIFLIALSTVMSNAQVILDPDTYDPADLPASITIVDIEGTNYFQVITAAWSTFLTVDPQLVVPANRDAFRCKTKYAIAESDTVTVAGINSFLKIYANVDSQQIAADAAASTSDFITRQVNIDLAGEWADSAIMNFQMAGQIPQGSWPATTGDTMWIGKVTLASTDWLQVDNNYDAVTIANLDDYRCEVDASWDVDTLYLTIMVQDDIIFNDGRNDCYVVDNVEIYLDMDNSKAAAKDANDYQLRLMNDSAWIGPCASESNEINGVNYSYALNTDIDGDTIGYTYTVNIPWDSAAHFNFDAAVGTQFGFEVCASDNDGNRRDQLTWNSTTGNIWEAPNYWGVLELAADGKFDIIADNEAPTVPANLDTTDASTCTNLTFGWDASTDNRRLAGYIINFNSGTADTIAGRSFNATGLTASTAYTFTVQAIDIYNNKSAVATVTRTTPVCGPDAVNSSATQEFTFFPNPATGNITIEGVDALQIDVIGLSGNLIMTVKNTNIIDVSDLNNGIYILRVNTYDAVLTSRFVKK